MLKWVYISTETLVTSLSLALYHHGSGMDGVSNAL